MSIKSTDVISADYLKITDFDNFFDIYTDDKGRYFYNLNSSLYLNIADDTLETYICDYDMHWPLVSYKLYGTPRLAWLLMSINNIRPERVFDILPAATSIKYISKDNAQDIVKSINGYE